MSHRFMMPARLSSEHVLDPEWSECALLRCQVRANKVHKGKALYRGHLLRHGWSSWSGCHGELLCLNHVVVSMWKELSGRGANVINVPFSMARMNFCESFYLWGERQGGVEVLLSKRAQYPRSESSYYSFYFCLIRAVGIENMLILCFVTYWIWLNLCLLGGLWRSY